MARAVEEIGLGGEVVLVFTEKPIMYWVLCVLDTYCVPGPMLACICSLPRRDQDPDWGTLVSFTFQGLVSAD